MEETQRQKDHKIATDHKIESVAEDTSSFAQKKIIGVEGEKENALKDTTNVEKGN